MKPTTLLIMAAGIGSRYKKSNSQSAIKQLEPVGMNSEIIMDHRRSVTMFAGPIERIFRRAFTTWGTTASLVMT